MCWRPYSIRCWPKPRQPNRWSWGIGKTDEGRAYPVHTPFRIKKRQNGPRIGERESVHYNRCGSWRGTDYHGVREVLNNPVTISLPLSQTWGSARKDAPLLTIRLAKIWLKWRLETQDYHFRLNPSKKRTKNHTEIVNTMDGFCGFSIKFNHLFIYPFCYRVCVRASMRALFHTHIHIYYNIYY